MKSLLSKQAERFLREQKNYRRWLAVFLCLAVIVTIGTAAALKYKGIAVTTDAAESEEIHTDVEVVSEVVENEIKRHVHTEECYELQLVCGYPADEEESEAGSSVQASESGSKTESKAPSKTEAPAETPSETGGHTHSDSCYTVTGGTETLTCGKEEHTHSDSCYSTKTVTETETETDEDGNETQKTVEKEETVLSCGKSEHEHGSSCYTSEGGERVLTCGQEESAPAAPAAEAEAAPAAEEAPEAPAAEEIPVTEENQSTDETSVTEEAPSVDETPAGEEETPSAEVIPEEEKETPAADTSSEGEAASTETTDAEHAHDDTCYELVLICGFEDALSDEMNLVQTAETENYKVTVTYSESAEIDLNDAELRVVEYAKDSDGYIECCTELDYQPDAMLNIGFYVGEEEIEPKKPVSVNIIDKNASNEADYEIAHFTNGDVERIESSGTKTGSGVETEFLLDSFSVVTLFSTYSENSGAEVAEVAPAGGIAHEKKVAPVDGQDDVYELTLNVKGAIGSTEDKAKLDIVFVVDTSGSMAYDVDNHSGWGSGSSRRTLVNNAIENLVDDLDNDNTVDARYKLVTFANNASMNSANSWMGGSTLKGRLPNNSQGGTNYQDALIKAGTAVSADKREDAKRIVIFLTDGAPTYYNKGNSYTGLGSSTSNTEVNKAVEGAASITSDCDYFFAVGFSTDMTNPNATIGQTNYTAYQILDKVADGTGASVKEASATTDLGAYFKSFQESLKRIRAVGVSFTDQLTNEVMLVNGSGEKIDNPGSSAWTCVIKDENGVDVTNEINPKTGNTYLADSGMTAHYNEEYDGETVDGLKVTFNPNYELIKDYTYEVTARIKVNKDLADAKYAVNGYSYPDKGEVNTGETSADKAGFFCNAEDSAKVNYSYIVGETTETHDALDYPRPVVQMKKVPEPKPIIIQDMGHNKYVEKVEGENDLYDLTLDITGEVASGTDQKPAKYDIMFVVDTSGSMKGDRLTSAKNALTNLTKDLADRKIDAMYNLVSFGSRAYDASGWKGRSDIDKTINALGADGGTNYQDGLVKAANGMTPIEGRTNAIRVVIFLTDGEPTYYLRKDSKVDNEGTATEGGGSHTTDNDFDGALMGAGAMAGKADYFYAIGFGSDMTSDDLIYDNDNGPDEETRWFFGYYTVKGYTAKSLLEAVRTATRIPGGETTTTTDLSGYFNAMIEDIVQYNCDHVTITDTLSQWAEISADVDGVPVMLKVSLVKKGTGETADRVIDSKTNPAGSNTVRLTLPKSADGNTTNPTEGWMEAAYNAETKKIELKFKDDYKLEAGYRYEVTIRIKPTDEAYEEMAKTSSENIHKGEAGTGETSADKDGLYSNNLAKVIYKFEGKDEETEYARPVIQATPAEITVTKTIEGLDSLTDAEKAKVFEKLRFSFDGDDENAVGLTENSDGTYSVSKKVTPGIHTVKELWESADVENYLRETTVTVNGVAEDVENVKDTDVEVIVTAVSSTETATVVAFTNRYEFPTQTVKLLKVNEDDKADADFIDLVFTVKNGELTENEQKALSEASEEEKKGVLNTILNGKPSVCTLTIDKDKKVSEINGYAVRDGLNATYIDVNVQSQNTEEVVLRAGKYIVTEADTLNNYLAINPFILEVGESGVEIGTIPGFPNDNDLTLTPADGKFEIKVTNRKIKLSELQLVKVDAQSSGNGLGQDEYTVLDGAVFDLYRGDDKEPIATGLTAVNGVITSEALKGLEAGTTYRLKETKAPAGYVLSPVEFSFSIAGGKDGDDNNIPVVKPQSGKSAFVALVTKNEEGRVVTCVDSTEMKIPYSRDENGNVIWTLAITNNTGAELPVTGGPGTAAYTFGGLAVIAAGLMYSLSMRRKREKGGLNS